MTNIYVTNVSWSIPFDNSQNGFSSQNVQQAIEEARQTAISTPRYTITCVMNGSLTDGNWITYSKLTPDASIIIPINSILEDLTWTNAYTNRSFDLEFYKNGRNTTKYYTIQIRNSTYGYYNSLNHSFNAGDTLDVKYVDRGNDANDLVLVLFFKAI